MGELKKDMQVTEIAPAELARLRDKVKPVSEKFSKDLDQAVVKELYAEIEKARGPK
jgi:TRAP-type transport system periplasmic protein